MMTDAGREFLVHRFVEDAAAHRRYSKSSLHSSDSEEPTSEGGYSEPEGARLSERAAYPSVHTLAGSMQLAATLASLGHMQFLQPAAAAAACTLPLLYPHLYQSLLTMPNLDLIRQRLQHANAVPPPERQDNKPEEEEKTNAQQAQPTPQGKSQFRKRVSSGDTASSSPKKHRQVKRVQSKADDETTSPVSGMYIRDAKDVPPPQQLSKGDEEAEDETALWVETSAEARAELALIPNIIGDYVCCLCKVRYEDAFKLARHKCPRIAHQEYRCPECSKVFSCPANLASHRRWHRPKQPAGQQSKAATVKALEEEEILPDDHPGESYTCQECNRRYDSHRLLLAHALKHTDLVKKEAEEGGGDVEVQCDHVECDLWFPNPDALQDHRSIAHEKIACGFCGQSMASVDVLVRHISNHHPS